MATLGNQRYPSRGTYLSVGLMSGMLMLEYGETDFVHFEMTSFSVATKMRKVVNLG
jgi:hypothetical protein